jgi:tetratricopeptide (TPR) repeat protein
VRLLLDEYSIGDEVKGVILFINYPEEKIEITFRKSHLPKNINISMNLGLYPFHHIENNDNSLESVYINYNKYLQSDTAFQNPYAIDSMLKSFNINDKGTLLYRPKYKQEEFWDELRNIQNKTWAKETVAKGVSYAHQGEYDSAVKCYKQALEVDSTCVDAMVALGAAYANIHKYEAALQEFHKALQIDPNDANASKYLQVTQQKWEEIRNKKIEKQEIQDQVNQRLKTLLTDEKIKKKKKKDKKEKHHHHHHHKKSKTKKHKSSPTSS